VKRRDDGLWRPDAGDHHLHAMGDQAIEICAESRAAHDQVRAERRGARRQLASELAQPVVQLVRRSTVGRRKGANHSRLATGLDKRQTGDPKHGCGNHRQRKPAQDVGERVRFGHANHLRLSAGAFTGTASLTASSLSSRFRTLSRSPFGNSSTT
jgi:hypothetical protein